jgi:hypothetical protein
MRFWRRARAAYAWWVVELGGSVPASEEPRRRPKTGRAMTITAARAARATSALRASTTQAQRSQKPVVSVLAGPPAKTHVGRLLMKLDAHDRAQLVMIAYETRLVVPS